MDKNIGLKLDGRYEVAELIGVGGMANVYKGIDIMENRVVAVKILKSEYSENEEFIKAFRNESKAIAVLSHPNIVKIFDVGYENDMQYIVMEYIDGITLKDFIEQQGLLKWRECVHFTIQILRALQLAHDRGIVHRDIKPQNVMLLSDGSIKVMDFGIARFSRSEPNRTDEKTMGSVHYVSPEQASGERTDERSDIYSVGVMMYEMLTGRKPFDGETAVEVALKHMNEQPKLPTEYVTSLYPGLEEIILHAMEKDVNKRYQSASSMIRDIEAFKADQSVSFGYRDGIMGDSANGKESKGIIKAFKLPKFVSHKTDTAVEDDYDDNDEYDDYDIDDSDDDDEPRRSYVLPILAAVTCTIIIVATMFVANVILGAFKTTASSSNDYVMPNLIGMNYYEARTAYTDIQLVASEEYNSEYDSGEIIYQEKAEGRIVKVGDTIKVTVSKGTRMITVPDVVGYHYNSAYAALSGEDLSVLRIEMESDDVAAGYVIKTDPAAGATIEEKTTVMVYVSLGSSTEDTTVPYVTGLTVSEAEDLINEYYLVAKIQYVESSEPEDTVIYSNFTAGDTVTRNTVVTLYVSDGTGLYSDPFEEDIIDDDSNNTFPGINGNHSGNMASVTLDIEIPISAKNSYTLTFVNQDTGEIVADEFSFRGPDYAGKTIQVAVNGSGTTNVLVEVKNSTSGVRTTLATYSVDFDSQTYYCYNYYSNSFIIIDMVF